MSVYVDPLQYYNLTQIHSRQARKYGNHWCHLFADTVEELHEFARKLGLRKSWFQDRSLPHYDLTPNKRRQALSVGAASMTLRDWLQRLRASV